MNDSEPNSGWTSNGLQTTDFIGFDQHGTTQYCPWRQLASVDKCSRSVLRKPSNHLFEKPQTIQLSWTEWSGGVLRQLFQGCASSSRGQPLRNSATTTCSYLYLQPTISASFVSSQDTLNGASPQSIIMGMSISRSSANRLGTANHVSIIASR